MHPLGHLRTFNFMLVFQAEHNNPDAPLPMLGVAGVFWRLPCSRHARFPLVTGSLVRERRKKREPELRLQVRQEEETYNIVGGPRLFGPSDSSTHSFQQQPPAVHFLLATWPVVGILFTALGVKAVAFKLNGFTQSSPLSMAKAAVINWADVLNVGPVWAMEVIARAQRSQLPA